VNDPAGVSIDSFCRPSSSPRAAAAGCTGSDGTALTDSSTACGMCSGEFFLFMGGCYSQQGTPGSEICTAASGGRCTTCNAGASGKYVIQNGDPSAAPGTECILCSDAAGANGYKGVAGCGTCTHTGSSAGTATCSACQAGAFLETGSQCTFCGAGCLECESKNQCKTCTAGKYLKTDSKTCVDAAGCPPGTYADPATGQCKDCATDTSVTDCTECAYDSALKKAVCSSCGSSKPLLMMSVDGSATCVDTSGCTGTHFLSNGDGKCIPCGDASDGTAGNTGVPGCKTCAKSGSNNPTCSVCLEGYIKQGDGPITCNPCGPNCATCTQAGDDKCGTCKPGYFLKTSGTPGQCFACDDANNQGVEGCAQCNGGATPTCTKCKPNYKENSVGTFSCTKVCEDPTVCGGTVGACGAIVVGGDGSVKYYCSYCGQSNYVPIDGICTSSASRNACASGACQSCAGEYSLHMRCCTLPPTSLCPSPVHPIDGPPPLMRPRPLEACTHVMSRHPSSCVRSGGPGRSGAQ
ncbi:Variant-specific surface protein, partial [Giardia duodenalis]